MISTVAGRGGAEDGAAAPRTSRTMGQNTALAHRAYGQLRRNTDRFIAHRLSEIALAVTFIITVKLFAYADRWNR